jgi:SAM-dependent methyltransferase
MDGPPESMDADQDMAQVFDSLLADFKRGQPVTDQSFDSLFPDDIRGLSEIHWTPVEVAIRAAALLAAGPRTRVLDVGSGCGKFCLVGAITTRSQYVGIEQRATLVAAARRARTGLKLNRVSFVHGDMTRLDWTVFDAFYLYNPFYEHQIQKIRIDDTLHFSPETFQAHVGAVERKLSLLKVGARVVTYHGFGGVFPADYRCLHEEEAGTGTLALWEKAPIRVYKPRDLRVLKGGFVPEST